MANPNEPRPDGSQPPQSAPLGSPFPQGPSGPHDASQGPPAGQGPPGPVPQGPPPPYAPQDPYQRGQHPQGPYQQGPHQPGQPPQGPPPGPYPPQYQGPPPAYTPSGQPPQGPPPGQPPYGYPGASAPQPGRRSAAPWLIVGGVALALVLLGGAALGGFWLYGGAGASGGASGPDGSGGGGAARPDGVETFEGLSKNHVDTGETVDYAQFPPVGGEHYNFWQNCGVYDEPVLTEAAVHSLEHGAVWITHDPGLSDDALATLTAHHTPGSYVLVSPMEGLPSPVVASAWGAQLTLDDPADPRLTDFLLEYEQSPDAPEPGAPCSGAFDGTQAEFDAEGAGAVDARMD
ncbi:DUF3105 domain-containing protein [Nocardiopsis eucommiae]|uniref:DUF3105 domain-containing protein n=1 Tax=Nocardiopsis eucommiae TaxID=2831970 RepID=UPI003D70B5BE